MKGATVKFDKEELLTMNDERNNRPSVSIKASLRNSAITARSSVRQVMGHERKMPLKDKISLGPLEKYTLYNRFPFKLSIHLCLMILTSVLIMISVMANQSYLRSQQYVWYKKFLDIDVPVNDDFNREKRIFTIGEEDDGLKDFMTTTLDNYYDLEDDE